MSCSRCGMAGHNARTCGAARAPKREAAPISHPSDCGCEGCAPKEEPSPATVRSERRPMGGDQADALRADALQPAARPSRIRVRRSMRRQGLAMVALLCDGLRFSHLIIDRLRERGEKAPGAIGSVAQLRESAAALPRATMTPFSALARTRAS